MREEPEEANLTKIIPDSPPKKRVEVDQVMEKSAMIQEVKLES